MKQRIIFLIFICIITWPVLLFAQELNEVAIFGFVTDSTIGQPVSGVLVEAINEADTTERSSAVSDANGEYRMNLVVTDVKSTSGGVPSEFQLLQNYPNPFNPSTVISFQIPQNSEVQLIIYNTLGQRVKTLVDQAFAPGQYSAVWDATDDAGRGVAAGIYFYQLRTESFIKTKKMVLLDGNSGSLLSSSPSLSQRTLRHMQLTKNNDLMVTIRASSSRIAPFEKRGIVITSQNSLINISVNVLFESVFNRDLIVVSEPTIEGSANVSGLAGAVVDSIVGTEKVTVVNQRTLEEVSMRVNYDGGFPLMSLGAQVGDELRITLFSEGQQAGESEEVIVEDNVPPRVMRSNITNGDKDIIVDAIIIIGFSEEINVASVNENSFFITDSAGSVPGTIGFLNDNTVATFKPDQPLAPLTTYTITVMTEVTDLQGINLADTFMSTFTTSSEAPETRIAFYAEIYGTDPMNAGSIYTMNSDGSDLQRLTKRNDVRDIAPDYSPDGTRIVYSRQVREPVEGVYDIYIMNWDGTFPENLTNTPDYTEIYPRFSPDGNKIAFTTDRDGNCEIYTMNINGTDLVNLTNNPDCDCCSDWSPDGEYIVFSSSRDGERDIFVMKNDGTNQINLTTNLTGDCISPAWSPDGTQIAFYRWWNEEIYLIDPGGSNLTYLTGGDSWSPGLSWSPDGTKLVFVDMDLDNGFAIAIINRDGTNRHHVTLPNWENTFMTPDWSPRNP